MSSSRRGGSRLCPTDWPRDHLTTRPSVTPNDSCMCIRQLHQFQVGLKSLGQHLLDGDASVALIRCTTLVPTPSALAVFKMPVPAARRVLMARSIFALVLGRPSRTPRARALASPALTRLRIISLSNSAKAPVT